MKESLVIDVSQPGVIPVPVTQEETRLLISERDFHREPISGMVYEEVLREVLDSVTRNKLVGPEGFYIPTSLRFLKEHLKREDIEETLYDRAYSEYLENPIYPGEHPSRESIVKTLTELLRIYPHLDKRPDQVKILNKNHLGLEDVTPVRYQEARDRVPRTTTKEVKNMLSPKPKSKLILEEESPKGLSEREPRILEGDHRLSRVISWCAEREYTLEDVFRLVDTLCPDVPDRFVKKCFTKHKEYKPASLGKEEIREVKKACGKIK